MTSARLGKMLACGVPYPLLGAARRTVARLHIWCALRAGLARRHSG